MSYITLADGGRLYYELHGNGEPVVLVSGLNGQASFWHEQISALAQQYQVLVFDQRGFGKSSQWQGTSVSVGQLRDDLLSLLDGLAITSVHLIGHSLGGAVAQTLAIENSERVRKLVLSASWGRSDKRFARLFEMRSAYLEHSGVKAFLRSNPLFMYPDWWIKEHPGFLDINMDGDEGHSFQKLMLARMGAVLTHDRLDDLPGIQSETLVLCAEDDVVTPISMSQEIAGQISDCRQHFFPTGGHFYPRVIHESFNAVLMGFLAL